MNLNEKILEIANDFSDFANYDRNWINDISLEDYLLLRSQALKESRNSSRTQKSSYEQISKESSSIIESQTSSVHNIYSVQDYPNSSKKHTAKKDIEPEVNNIQGVPQRKSAMAILRNVKEM